MSGPTSGMLGRGSLPEAQRLEELGAVRIVWLASSSQTCIFVPSSHAQRCCSQARTRSGVGAQLEE